MPLCARCTGILVGFLAGLVLVLQTERLPLYVYGLFLLPMILDGGTQSMRLRESNNSLRFLTGVLFGAGYLALIFFFFLHVSFLLAEGW